MDISKLFKSKHSAFVKTFESEEGKKVLADLYKVCRIDQPSYVEGCPDKTAFNEGVKWTALYIKKILKQSNEDVDKFLEEYKKTVSNNKLLNRSK